MEWAFLRGAAVLLTVAALGCGVAPVHASSCIKDGRIHVFQTIDLSGPQRWVGLEYRDGANLLLERVNREGGVHGRKITLATADDKFHPSTTASNIRAALDSQPFCAIFGTMGTAQTLAAVEAAGNLPLIAPLTGTLAIRPLVARLSSCAARTATKCAASCVTHDQSA
ncbi:ABC transporter substrate-binding protein [Pusillimonas sp.]|uniref:ABC transporter substrate-binding protein n=1 Tax=Pusillimonas sp. TaxID=3040095 RepID=UPI0037CA57FA